MLKSFTALLCGAFLLSACTPKSEVKSSSVEDTRQRYEMCVAGYVETSPGKGTLDIFYVSDYAPDIQNIVNVSVKVAKEVTEMIGTC